MLTELRSHLDAFITSADEGSFSAAARLLGLTPAAISKSVGQLEVRLGVRLFQRSTRHLALTTDGERLYAQVRLPWSEINDALTDLRQGAGKPAGTLKVALAHTVGREYIVPLLGEFLHRYPDVLPDLHFDNRQVDIVAAGFDVAIGGGIELTDALIARELARLRIVLVAAPAYLKAHPAPQHPQDLARHHGLLRRSLATGRLIPWALKSKEGQELVASVRPSIVMDDPEAMARAAATGMGIALLPLPHALPLLESGALERVLPDWYAESRPLSIYYTSRKLVPAKVRVFVDYIVQEFATSGLAARIRQT
ncbi:MULTISPECIES: LysR family transcriptional regulator [Comamonas]|jgi:DNA-binding transcriptional LysR family regulator|uniref:LysR family transcriptional regulator n=1 Tax=Comamonas terrigena TaxID=32013 RepID=A0A2A7UV08_COMTR|nr:MULTISPECIES: LysR family transcriptional regulator [Comamonas]MBD9530412.1 LysR family transcriptional regulator [Comamonas sp. CMM01]MDH0050566.1 LysR family transcriptional regulator [Comamonas terrigena]MDH0512956.1 LysR family transcriptional regulator [Comamonas terrigena]MDH1092358.1 LysR family transcriptional regulator [Comamonas terrigena]MDH1503282.1 LysR family transcriptional regulator [Comamonas terrigena]